MSETPGRLGSRYHIDVGQLDFAPNADVRPTTLNPVILLQDGKRAGELMHSGLVPYWANDSKAISNCFNARS